MKRVPCVVPGLFLAALLGGSAQEKVLYFIQLTDTQFGMYTGDKGFEQESANCEFAVKTVNRLKPDFVVVTGDFVNKPGDPAQTSEYLRISRQVSGTIAVYHVPGNHDVGNEPTPDGLAAYRKNFGKDYYSFRAGPLFGIVLDSPLIYAPAKAPEEFDRQDAWLRNELGVARSSGARPIVVFQHHPYFVRSRDENDEYHNIPRERRWNYLDPLHGVGVRYVFAGHYHQNALARDGDLEIVTTGPVGNPLGRGKSGLRIAALRETRIEHRYFDFGDLPRSLSDAFK